MRAAIRGITTRNFDQGASTITQQLIKNAVFNVGMDETSFLEKFERKIWEQSLAIELEKKYTKEQILEYYLNTIYLGSGVNGVEAASETYFGKKVSELTVSEASVIAGITQNPYAYDPNYNPEDNAKRRKLVLKKMLELDYIDQAEYDEFIERHNKDRVERIEGRPYDGDAYLGIDSGSTTLKVVLTDDKGSILYSRYESNQGKPIDVVTQSLKEMYAKYPNATIQSSAVTGYGGLDPLSGFLYRLVTQTDDGDHLLLPPDRRSLNLYGKSFYPFQRHALYHGSHNSFSFMSFMISISCSAWEIFPSTNMRYCSRGSRRNISSTLFVSTRSAIMLPAFSACRVPSPAT